MMPPVLDHSVLQALAMDIGAPAATRFAHDVARLWPRRRARLASALELGDPRAALDAALSLRSASAMVGAVQLAALADRIAVLIRSEGTSAALPLLVPATACGDLTARALVRGHCTAFRRPQPSCTPRPAR